MIDLDTIAREHGRVVREAVANTDRPPIGSLSPGRRTTSPSPLDPRLVVAAAVLFTAAVIGFVAVLGTKTIETVAGSTDSTASLANGSSPVSTTRSIDALPFDVQAFVAAERGALFGDDADRIGVAALVPLAHVERFYDVIHLANLNELETFVAAEWDVVRSRAEAFADREGTAPLEDFWFAVGFIPRFADSPTAQWAERIAGRAGSLGTVVVALDFEPPGIPDGWTAVADVPFGTSEDASVVGVDSGMLVVDADATSLVRPDGSIAVGEPPPAGIPGPCCGEFRSDVVGDAVVFTRTASGESWLFEVDGMSWREIDRRPLLRSAVGSAVVDGKLVVVEQAGRSIVAESRVVVLDPATGEWTSLPSLPEGVDVGGVTTDGERVYVAGTSQDLNGLIVGDQNPRLYVLDGSGVWETLPEIPIRGQASTIGWVGDKGLLAWNYDLEAALLDDSGTWQPLESVPIAEAECYPHVDVTTYGVVGFCSEPVFLDGESVTWVNIEPVSQGRYAVLDTEILALMRSERNGNLLVRFPLPPPPTDE